MQNVNKVILNCKQRPTLSCLIAEKKLNSQMATSFYHNNIAFSPIRMGEWEFKKEGWRKEQAKFEKENVKVIEDGR